MSINEEELRKWIEQVTKKLSHLEANQTAIINGDFCGTSTESKEPLIKDEKIRKAVRAWAEANGIENDAHVFCGKYDNGFDTGDICIDFDIFIYDVSRAIEKGKNYTIAELCGEEEAPEPLEPTFFDMDERIKEKEEE